MKMPFKQGAGSEVVETALSFVGNQLSPKIQSAVRI